jgi:hypothetical protein
MENNALSTSELRAKRWNAKIAREVLDELAASGMSLAAFARSRGVNFQRLFWWRKRLGQTRPAKSVTFIPATILSGPSITLRLPGGIAVEAADAAALPVRWVAELARSLASTP